MGECSKCGKTRYINHKWKVCRQCWTHVALSHYLSECPHLEGDYAEAATHLIKHDVHVWYTD